MANESNIKMLFFLERLLPFSLEFCKLNISDLLFSINGISFFEKVFRYDSSSFNKLFMKMLLSG